MIYLLMRRKIFRKWYLRLGIYFAIFLWASTYVVFPQISLGYLKPWQQVSERFLQLKPTLILREELIRSQENYSLVFRQYGIHSALNSKIFEARQFERKMLFENVPYVNEPFQSKIYMNGNIVEQRNGRTITGIQRYFHALRTSTGYCRKLARIGGEVSCNSNSGDENGMDGNKLICMHPAFQIGSRNYTNCLVLSFGVYVDTSFDESIADLNCHVHMFDIVKQNTDHLKNDKKFHFHQVGLAANRHAKFYKKENLLVNLDSLNNIVVNLKLEKSLINILKIDIEGYEWDVLHDLSTKLFLNVIGQIAVEVHAMDLAQLTHEERLKRAEHFISAIEALEARGFQRVAYWDNVNSKSAYIDDDGTMFETAGELLLVNSNWYNETFRAEIKKYGYNFL